MTKGVWQRCQAIFPTQSRRFKTRQIPLKSTCLTTKNKNSSCFSGRENKNLPETYQADIRKKGAGIHLLQRPYIFCKTKKISSAKIMHPYTDIKQQRTCKKSRNIKNTKKTFTLNRIIHISTDTLRCPPSSRSFFLPLYSGQFSSIHKKSKTLYVLIKNFAFLWFLTVHAPSCFLNYYFA